MSTLNYWNYPTEILCGVGALDQLAERCRLAGMFKPLLVTDPGMLELPPLHEVRRRLEAAGIDYALFHGFSSNPALEEVSAGAGVLAEGGHDSLIALGGGSALDAAKGIALLSRDANGLHNFEWSQLIERYPTLGDHPALDLPPLIAIPTTAGTGSELGREAVLTDTARGIKIVVGHRELLARSVILDPVLTVGLPKSLTAATGMDALTHHLESLFSPLYHPMSAGVAIEGVRLVKEHLQRAVRNGTDLAAREGMLVASASAAVAFQKGLGACTRWPTHWAPSTTSTTACSTPCCCRTCWWPTARPSKPTPRVWRATWNCRKRASRPAGLGAGTAFGGGHSAYAQGTGPGRRGRALDRRTGGGGYLLLRHQRPAAAGRGLLAHLPQRGQRRARLRASRGRARSAGPR